MKLLACNNCIVQVPGDAEIMIQTLARERPPPAPMPPSDFPADVGAILAGAASPSAAATPAAAVPPNKTLSGPPSSPVCALDTPFGSSGSDASSALSRRFSLDRASSHSGGNGGQSPSPPGSWGGRAARSGRGGSLGRGSGHASSSGGSAWGRRVVDFFTSCSDPRSAGEGPPSPALARCGCCTRSAELQLADAVQGSSAMHRSSRSDAVIWSVYVNRGLAMVFAEALGHVEFP